MGHPTTVAMSCDLRYIGLAGHNLSRKAKSEKEKASSTAKAKVHEIKTDYICCNHCSGVNLFHCATIVLTGNFNLKGRDMYEFFGFDACVVTAIFSVIAFTVGMVFAILGWAIIIKELLFPKKKIPPTSREIVDYDSPQLFEPLTFEEFSSSLEEFANGLIFCVFHNYPGVFDEFVITEEDIQEMKNNKEFMLCLNSLIRKANDCPRTACRSSYKIGDERGFSAFYRLFLDRLLESDAMANISEKLKQKLSFQHHHRWREWRISPPYC